MRVLAIDPGTTQSGYAHMEDGRVIDSGILDNDELLSYLQGSDADASLAIEMIASYGMAVGKEVFETCVWIGRFMQMWQTSNKPATLIYRRDVKLHLCGSVRAKDANIRQALIDKLGPQGTKKEPGPTYGVKSHAWAALAVAVTFAETKKDVS